MVNNFVQTGAEDNLIGALLKKVETDQDSQVQSHISQAIEDHLRT